MKREVKRLTNEISFYNDAIRRGRRLNRSILKSKVSFLADIVVGECHILDKL